MSAFLASALPFAAGTYAPTDLGGDLLAGATSVLPWVGAAVGASIGIVFVLIGIKKGIAWGRQMISRG